MAGASDKARFYLEQAVPELREWERRGIFTKDEISSTAAKRSDFEHVLNARGSKPSDYARYAEYEMNLDSLRRRRVSRKGVKGTAHTGQRRVFFILDRATKKFHGDVGLWIQYIEYARKQRANKKLTRILTDALRMHPTRPELWIYAARYAMDVQADVGAARSYMQRGLRFCKNSRSMYIEYARLEMTYIAKIAKRRNVMGLSSQKKIAVNDVANAQRQIEEAADQEADMISLTNVTAGETGTTDVENLPEDDKTANDLSTTPALNGAIPLAIFEAARKQFHDDPEVARSFFDMLVAFLDVPCSRQLLQAVVESLGPANTPAASSCRARLHLIGVAVDSPDFPSAVGATVRDLRSALKAIEPAQKPALAAGVLAWLSPLADEEAMGPEVKQVLLATQTQLAREVGSQLQTT